MVSLQSALARLMYVLGDVVPLPPTTGVGMGLALDYVSVFTILRLSWRSSVPAVSRLRDVISARACLRNKHKRQWTGVRCGICWCIVDSWRAFAWFWKDPDIINPSYWGRKNAMSSRAACRVALLDLLLQCDVIHQYIPRNAPNFALSNHQVTLPFRLL